MSSCKKRTGINGFLLYLIIMSLVFACIPIYSQAAEPRQVSVKLQLTPDLIQYDPNSEQEILIEATTEKKGDSYEVRASLESSYNGQEEISFETELVNGYYVSKAKFTPYEITNYTINYEIMMYDKNRTWIGQAKRTIRSDNMPPAIPSVEGKLTISPKNQLEVGKTIKFTSTIPNFGEIYKEDYYFPHPFQEKGLEDFKTKKSGRNYISTGSFTPKKPGKYRVVIFLIMRDKNGKHTEGSSYIEFEVKDSPVIHTSLSPNTASMKLGEEIYLVATYQAIEGIEHKISWNLPAEEELTTFNQEKQAYQTLIKFKPDKKKTYTFEVKVNQVVDGQQKTGKATTNIMVR